MIRTVELSPYIYAQGILVATLPCGQLAVSVDGRELVGKPVVPCARDKPSED